MDAFDYDTFDDLCGVGVSGAGVWLLNTGLAGVRGHVGDGELISKSSWGVAAALGGVKWL